MQETTSICLLCAEAWEAELLLQSKGQPSLHFFLSILPFWLPIIAQLVSGS
jgi:hypothetical protein